MRKLLSIILVLLVGFSGMSQNHLQKVANETTAALRGYEDLERPLLIHLNAGKPEASQMDELKANIKTYYDSLLKINADFNNENIDRGEMRKQRSVVYHDYQEKVKSIYSPAQFELYQSAFYSKSEEKKLKKYLRKYGYIK